jgi:hypothetical protein
MYVEVLMCADIWYYVSDVSVYRSFLLDVNLHICTGDKNRN